MQKSKRWNLWRGLLAAVLILSMVWSNGAAYALASSLEVADTQTLRVLVISIDPEINNPTVDDPESIFYGREKLLATEYLGFSLEESVASLKSQIERSSHHTVAIEVVETMWCNEFPVYNGYDSMNEEVFLELFYPNRWGVGEWYGWWSRNAGGKYIPEELDGGFNFDYQHLLDECNLVEKKNNDEFDAVWVFSIDPSSMYEFNMVGRTPLWLNGSTIQADCDNFALGGLTFSRRDGAIESFGHASESMLNHSFGTYLYYGTKLDFADFDEWNMWQKFYYSKSSATEEDKASEDTVYGVGNVHFSPNSEYDYDWSNNTPVYSYYEEFANDYPNIDGTPSIFTAESAYLGTEEDPCRSHHVWWFGLMPHYKGRDEDGYSNNWWDYLLDTKYVTRVACSDQYKNGTIEVSEYETIDNIDFKVTYSNGKTVTLNAAEEEVNLKLTGDNLVEVDNGVVLALEAGTGLIEFKYDGQTIIYEVVVNSNASSDEEEGTEVTEDFLYDAEYYAKANEDVAVALNYDEEAMYQHWLNYGKAEGRNASLVFNAKYYLEANPELEEALGSNYEAAYKHFVNVGLEQGLESSPVFDVKYYLEANSDVAGVFGTDYVAAAKHFAQNALAESRSGSGNFDYTVYADCNKDVAELYGSDVLGYYIHYINHGRAEGRTAGLGNNADIIIDENAVSYRIFDAAYYLEQYPELETVVGTDANALYLYWMNTGIDLGQTASPVIVPEEYLELNQDVSSALGDDAAVAIKHFLNYGIQEGRTASYEFDYTIYKYCNTDVVEVFGEDIVGYYFHYVKYGKAENRTASVFVE